MVCVHTSVNGHPSLLPGKAEKLPPFYHPFHKPRLWRWPAPGSKKPVTTSFSQVPPIPITRNGRERVCLHVLLLGFLKVRFPIHVLIAASTFGAIYHTLPDTGNKQWRRSLMFVGFPGWALWMLRLLGLIQQGISCVLSSEQEVMPLSLKEYGEHSLGR